ncbi:hypothetical protein NPIL_292221 [Nephila pilipes]|uniref:Uncharacterized protein n=1 Tax=Nephila pilipes TaxID=299642 RepID=A0A8X6NZW6_NEPPI|nr:hypothetical protein NPIL_292221 [Nephila pilipes]
MMRLNHLPIDSITSLLTNAKNTSPTTRTSPHLHRRSSMPPYLHRQYPELHYSSQKIKKPHPTQFNWQIDRLQPSCLPSDCSSLPPNEKFHLPGKPSALHLPATGGQNDQSRHSRHAH